MALRIPREDMVKVRLTHEFHFEAAHRLPRVPAGHRCERLHGHSFRIEVAIHGPVDPTTGWLMDFAELKRAWEPLYAELDHRCLNDVPGLDNPTSENLAHWLWERLKGPLPLLERVTVHETCSARCDFEGEP